MEHIQSAIVEPAVVLDNDSRNDLCRSLLWYARCRSDLQAVQQMMNSLQTVLEMSSVPEQVPAIRLIMNYITSTQSIVGALFGAVFAAATGLLCSSWQLLLLLTCIVVAGLFLLFHRQ